MYEAIVRISHTRKQPLAAASPSQALQEAGLRLASQKTQDTEDMCVELVGVRNLTTGEMLPASASGALPPPGMFDVHWSMRVQADSALDSACCARFAQYQADSQHATYRVCDSTGTCQVIDLQQPEIVH